MATRHIPRSIAARPIPPGRMVRRLGPVGRPQDATYSDILRIAPFIILLIGVLLPVEIRINIAGQTFYGYRLAWLLVAPWTFYRILAGHFQLLFNDVLVLVASFWIAISFGITEGMLEGLPSGIAIALDILVPYLTVRLSIRSFDDLRRLLVVLAPVAFALAIMMVIESVTHVRFIRGGAQAIFGSLGAAEYGGNAMKAGGIDLRYGLLRAMGPFSHPILAGVFFAGLLPLYYYSRLRGWPFFAGLVAGATAVFSLSSAAVLAIAMFTALAVYDYLRKIVTFLNWQLFIATAGTLALMAHLFSSDGLIYLMIRSTMRPASGYYRLLIWEYGSKSVEKNPWFGIGYEKFEGLKWMTDSIDTIWLSLAIRSGLVPALAMALAVVLAIAGLAIATGRHRQADAEMCMGLAIALTMFFILGFTVSFFGGLLIWFVMLLAVGTTLAAVVTVPRRIPRPQLRPTIQQ